MQKNAKPHSVDTLRQRIDEILLKNRESLTVDELKTLEEVRTKLSSNGSTNQFIKTALSNLFFRTLFEFFLGDEFEKWKQMLDEWFKGIDSE